VLGIGKDPEITKCKRIHKNYLRLIKKLKKRSEARRLRVAFLVNENAKWSCQSLYEEFDRSDRFEPIILVTGSSSKKEKAPSHMKKVNETYDFFKSRNMNAQYAYSIKEQQFMSLNQFNPDIVFYQQPWELDPLQSPLTVGKFALTCYVPYTIAGTSESMKMYPKSFLYCLWKHFIVSDTMKNEYESWMLANKQSLVVTGHPKLDSYSKRVRNDKHYIIYAPHFALGNSLLKLSTFDWNGRYLLDFARSHKELNWVFKPHPLLKNSIVRNGIMTEDEVSGYYDEWVKIGIVYDQGDYFGIFQNSDALITDGSSFLSEYLPTGMPVIHLISKDKVESNPTARMASAHYYEARDLKELEFYLNDIIIGKNDPLKEERIDDISSLISGSEPASIRIINHLVKELHM
jgi:hypothetical protein